MAQNKVVTRWVGNMAFESSNPSGHTLRMDAPAEVGGEDSGLRPKAMMLSSLAGCSGLDVVSLLNKMRVNIDDFEIITHANLTEEHPKIYDKVTIEYVFSGDSLPKEKIEKAVKLSVDKYCGVMEMFRQFAELDIQITLKENSK